MKPSKPACQDATSAFSDDVPGRKKVRRADSGFDDNGGLLRVMQQFNETNVKLRVDLITTSNDMKDQLRRLEERLTRKMKDIETRQEAMEIIFENQEKDVDYLKNMSRFLLECLNGLFQVVLQLYTEHQREATTENQLDTDNESAPTAPVTEQMNLLPVQASSQVQSQTARQQLRPDVYTFQPEASPSENMSIAEDTVVNDDCLNTENKCGYCNRCFKKERNFLKHMERIPKYCARKRIKLDVPF